MSRGTFRPRKWCPELAEGHLPTKGNGVPSLPRGTFRQGNGVPSLPRGTFRQGNGVPSLSRGTFPRRKWCPELVEGHLPTKEMVSRTCRGAPSDVPPMFYCYILLCSDSSYYVGVTDNLDQRVQRHNQGTASDWTSRCRPVSLVWSEEHPTLSSARMRENQLKRWSHAKKAALVAGSPRLRSEQGP